MKNAQIMLNFKGEFSILPGDGRSVIRTEQHRDDILEMILSLSHAAMVIVPEHEIEPLKEIYNNTLDLLTAEK